jgi:thiamine biosynthesis lipoprotein
VSEYRFASMGCEVVVGGAERHEASVIERLFEERDHAFSRFRPESELSRVNRQAGRPAAVSPLFAETVEIALRAAAETDGLVDPTLGAAIESAGYTEDFDALTPDPRPAGPPHRGSWRAVSLLGRCVALPASVRLDLNGVVKALAVDAGLEVMSGPGFVSAGGDLAARGDLTVELPDGATILLRRGALATSGTARRRWLRGGAEQHHLIDPRTGRPSTSPWTQVTACAATCLGADLAAKAGFLLGEAGPPWLDRRGLPGRFLDASGAETVNESWRRSLEAVDACT